MIQFWLKIEDWNERLVEHAIVHGINGLYLPPGHIPKVDLLPGILSISADPRADIVLGRDAGEVLVESIDQISAVARHHGAILTIVYCSNWHAITFQSLLTKSGNLLQHSTKYEDAQQGAESVLSGGRGIVLESTDEHTIEMTGAALSGAMRRLKKIQRIAGAA